MITVMTMSCFTLSHHSILDYSPHSTASSWLMAIPNTVNSEIFRFTFEIPIRDYPVDRLFASLTILKCSDDETHAIGVIINGPIHPKIIHYKRPKQQYTLRFQLDWNWLDILYTCPWYGCDKWRNYPLEYPKTKVLPHSTIKLATLTRLVLYLLNFKARKSRLLVNFHDVFIPK